MEKNSQETYIELYRQMKRIRMVEDAIADNYNNTIREMHTPIHLCSGQEAVAVGVCSEMERKDVIFSNHRGHGHYLAKGGDLKRMMAELFNKETGCCKGRGGSMHLLDMEAGVALTSAIVAGNVSMATGYALADKMKENGGITVAFFGDGASEEGNVYECICFAMLMRLPILFVCENNLYAISTPMSKREPTDHISDKFKGILPCKIIDGNDVLSVKDTAHEAALRARSAEGPTLIECKTYRLRDHHNVGNGIDGIYRLADEIERWERKSPIDVFRNLMADKGWIDRKMDMEIEDEIRREIDEAFKYAHESELPKPEELQKGLWG